MIFDERYFTQHFCPAREILSVIPDQQLKRD